jgi:hypothetical protein
MSDKSTLDHIAFKSIQDLSTCKYFYLQHIEGSVGGIAWNQMGIKLSKTELDYIKVKVIDGLNKVKEAFPERYL